jgi:hypothetical protein
MTIPKEQIEALKRDEEDYYAPIEEMLRNEGWNAAVDHLAAQGRIAPDGWVAVQGGQPIETAPKDGTQIMLMEFEEDMILRILPFCKWCIPEHNPHWGVEREQWCCTEYKYFSYGTYEKVPQSFKATHWMPLPEPPKEGE